LTGQEPVAKGPAAFEWRCMPPDGVAPRSSTPDILRRRALSGGRLADPPAPSGRGATRGSATGSWPEPSCGTGAVPSSGGRPPTLTAAGLAPGPGATGDELGRRV